MKFQIKYYYYLLLSSILGVVTSSGSGWGILGFGGALGFGEGALAALVVGVFLGGEFEAAAYFVASFSTSLFRSIRTTGFLLLETWLWCDDIFDDDDDDELDVFISDLKNVNKQLNK